MSKLNETTIVKFFLVIITIFFLAILLIKRFMYFRPSSHFVSTTEPYKTIRVGHLHGWLLESADSDKIILLCQGNDGNISRKESKIIALRNMGYSVLVFDYSGYGKSTGVPSEQTLYDDASSMVAFLRQTHSPEQIILYGECIGCPIATYAARRYSIGTLILESPVPNMKSIIRYRYPMLSSLSVLFPEFDTVQYLNGFKGKSLIMHSPTDEIIPYTSIAEMLKFCSYHIQLDGSHKHPIIPFDQVQQFIRESTK